jgi:ribosome-associated heat shock protein Hsp15
MGAHRADVVDSEQVDRASESMRLDIWLWYARFYKSRSLATAAVQGGKVHLNGQRVKAAHRVRPGDEVSITRTGLQQTVTVQANPTRRGPAMEAASCYVESAASVARREALRAQQRLAAAFSPQTNERPDKHARRDLRRLRGRE